MNRDAHTIANGVVGMFATIASFIVSFLPHLELFLRILSLLIGCLVGSVTLYRLINPRNHKKKVITFDED